tara:strand:+ start:1566 stop:1817 length:252 start_codon:yes stop_codon:yes gene_type:complete
MVSGIFLSCDKNNFGYRGQNMRHISPLKIEIFKRGLVQADVAQDAGISESRLSRILNGRVQPFDYEIKNLAHALGIPKEDIRV